MFRAIGQSLIFLRIVPATHDIEIRLLREQSIENFKSYMIGWQFSQRIQDRPGFYCTKMQIYQTAVFRHTYYLRRRRLLYFTPFLTNIQLQTVIYWKNLCKNTHTQSKEEKIIEI